MIINRELTKEVSKSKEELIEEYIKQQYETMETAKPYVTKMKNGIETAIKLFEENNVKEAVEMCSFIEEGAQWISEVARLTKDIQIKQINEIELDGKIDELAEAYQNEDYILMGDLLKYEILPIMENWEEAVMRIAKNNLS